MNSPHHLTIVDVMVVSSAHEGIRNATLNYTKSSMVMKVAVSASEIKDRKSISLVFVPEVVP